MLLRAPAASSPSCEETEAAQHREQLPGGTKAADAVLAALLRGKGGGGGGTGGGGGGGGGAHACNCCIKAEL